MNRRFLCCLVGVSLLSGFTALQASAEQGSAPASTSQVKQCKISDTQQAWLERVNKARAQARRCGDKQFAAVKPLSWSCRLEAAAKAHSNNMAKNNFFSHTDPDGGRVGQRVTAKDYTWRTVGENIAAGQKSGDAVMDGWLASPGHCANIMKKKFTEMGMSRVDAPEATYSPYWTQVFGRPR